jgi:hypothetical protein
MLEIAEEERLEFALDMEDAILTAMAHVTDSRKRRGKKQIRALEMARAELVLAAAERRRGTGLPQRRTKARRDTAQDRLKSLGRTRSARAGGSVGGDLQGRATGTKRIKRKAPNSSLAAAEHDERGKRALGKRDREEGERKEPDKRQNTQSKAAKRTAGAVPEQETQRAKRANRRSTADKREHEDDDEEEKADKRPKRKDSKGQKRDRTASELRDQRHRDTEERQAATKAAEAQAHNGQKRDRSEVELRDQRHRDTRERLAIGTTIKEPD